VPLFIDGLGPGPWTAPRPPPRSAAVVGRNRKKPEAKLAGGFKRKTGVKSSVAVCVFFKIQTLQRAKGGHKSLTILALK